MPIEMQVVIACPNNTNQPVETGRTVATATEFKEGQFSGVIAQCPVCGEQHRWTKEMAWPSFPQ